MYDEAGHIIGEYNSSTGKASKEFIYLGDTSVGVLEQVATGTAPNLAYATNVYFIYTDHLDTPRVITRSPDGQMVWRWDSGDPFGLLPPNKNPVGLGVFTFHLRMPGQYYDKSTNLFYNYFRHYDPQLGRYVQSDPIGLNGGINTYGYADGDPLYGIDALGLANSGWKPSPGLRHLRMPSDPLPILQATYKVMQDKDVPGTDQFFHSMATCRAKENGSTPP